MAKVYAAPVDAPAWSEYDIDGRFSPDKMAQVNAAYTGKVAAALRKLGYNHKLTGEIIRFQVADGYAQYMIADGQTIIHLDLMDGYEIPDAHARGLRASDLADLVAARKRLEALFRRRENSDA